MSKRNYSLPPKVSANIDVPESFKTWIDEIFPAKTASSVREAKGELPKKKGRPKWWTSLYVRGMKRHIATAGSMGLASYHIRTRMKKYDQASKVVVKQIEKKKNIPAKGKKNLYIVFSTMLTEAMKLGKKIPLDRVAGLVSAVILLIDVGVPLYFFEISLLIVALAFLIHLAYNLPGIIKAMKQYKAGKLKGVNSLKDLTKYVMYEVIGKNLPIIELKILEAVIGFMATVVTVKGIAKNVLKLAKYAKYGKPPPLAPI